MKVKELINNVWTKYKKWIVIIGITILVLLAAYCGGLYTGYKISMGKYKTDLATARSLFAESERTNRELTIDNHRLTDLNIQSQATIDRLRQSAYQAGIGAGNIKDGNNEAKGLVSDLNKILQSIESSQ